MDTGQSSKVNNVSLLGLGQAWTRVGYGVLALGVASFVLWQILHPILPYAKGTVIPDGYRLMTNKDGGIMIRASIYGALSLFLLVFSSLAGLVYTLVDVIDRKKRFVWLMPLFICPFVQGLHALPFALYLFYGRETSAADANVS